MEGGAGVGLEVRIRESRLWMADPGPADPGPEVVPESRHFRDSNFKSNPEDFLKVTVSFASPVLLTFLLLLWT